MIKFQVCLALAEVCKDLEMVKLHGHPVDIKCETVIFAYVTFLFFKKVASL